MSLYRSESELAFGIKNMNEGYYINVKKMFEVENGRFGKYF